MERWSGRVALVTGASVGIGASLVRKLANDGMKVIGCARNVKQIQAIADELKSSKGSLTAMQCDLNKEEDILAMFARIKTEFGGVDVCVNNAGLGHDAPILTGATDQWREMLNVNVLAPTICSREAFKQMKQKGTDDGHIIIINSMSGHRIVPSNNTHFYSMTKYAVTGLTESLRQELRSEKSHIRVSAVSSGMVRTEFSSRLLKSEEEGNKRYAMMKPLEAEDIVDAIIYQLAAPAHVQVHDILIRPTDQIS